MKETRITATELARNLSDVLNRVKYRGESFIVERGGETLALLAPSPSSAPKNMTWGEFAEWWKSVPKPDPGFWDDVEWAHKNQPPMPEPPSWD